MLLQQRRQAAEGAGAMNASGRYYLLLPREVGARIGTAAPAALAN